MFSRCTFKELSTGVPGLAAGELTDIASILQNTKFIIDDKVSS